MVISRRPAGADVVADASCGPFGLRERKKAQTREAIIDAALDLFERNGFEATTVEDIAAEADVSPRTFFRYFESKIDVVMARNHAKEARLGDLVVARPADEGPIEAVRQVTQEALGELLADASALRELKVVMAVPGLRTLALEHFHEHQDDLVAAFAARLGVDEDALQAHVLGAAVSTMLWTVVDRWVAEGGRPDRLLPMLDEGFALLARGLDGKPG
jgi:AcrR family transcriptional regulator